jgi:hypothetical protein
MDHFLHRDMPYKKLPLWLVAGVQNWIEKGVYPGLFLMKVIENDLIGAVNYADCSNEKHIVKIAKWLYTYAPSGCWGSKEKVKKWPALRKKLTSVRSL